jgi:hypothetical protein
MPVLKRLENFKVGALTLTLSSHRLLRREDRETELRMAPAGGGHKMASQNPVPWRFWMDLRLATTGYAEEKYNYLIGDEIHCAKYS